MQVPQLDIHKKRNSIFEKRRYSPEKDIDQKLKRVERTTRINNHPDKNIMNQDRLYQNNQKRSQIYQKDVKVRQKTAYTPIFNRTIEQQPIKRSPHKRRFSYLPQSQDLIQEQIQRIVHEDSLLPNHMHPYLPYIHHPPLIPYTNPIIIPPEPILMPEDVSSFLTSPIINQAPSTYFQLSQRILSRAVPRQILHPYPIVPIISNSYMSNYRRQSPSRDISRLNESNDCSCDPIQKSSSIGFLNKNVYIKQNTNTSNIKQQPRKGWNQNKQIGNSGMSFGGNNNNNNNTNTNTNNNNNNNNNINPIPQKQTGYKGNKQQNIPQQIYQIFRKILSQQRIQPPPQYPQSWMSIIKQCQDLSKQQRTKLIQLRLKAWKKIRQTITQQTMDIDNSIFQQTLRKLEYDNLVYEQKMRNLQNQGKTYTNRTQNIVNQRTKKLNLDDLVTVREEYVETRNQQIQKIDGLIRQAEERINYNHQTIQPFSYFQ